MTTELTVRITGTHAMHTSEPTLDDVAREYPRWHYWEDANGLLSARLRGSSPPVTIQAAGPDSLHHQIHHWIKITHPGGASPLRPKPCQVKAVTGRDAAGGSLTTLHGPGP